MTTTTNATRCVVVKFVRVFGELRVRVLKGVNVYVYAFDCGLRDSNMYGMMFWFYNQSVYRAAGARSRNANGCALFKCYQ